MIRPNSPTACAGSAPAPDTWQPAGHYPPTRFDPADSIVCNAGGWLWGRRDLRGDDGELIPGGDYVKVWRGTRGFVLSTYPGQLPIVGFNLAEQGARGIAYAFCTSEEIVPEDEFSEDND